MVQSGKKNHKRFLFALLLLIIMTALLMLYQADPSCRLEIANHFLMAGVGGFFLVWSHRMKNAASIDISSRQDISFRGLQRRFRKGFRLFLVIVGGFLIIRSVADILLILTDMTG